jgi:hypothetical protein
MEKLPGLTHEKYTFNTLKIQQGNVLRARQCLCKTAGGVALFARLTPKQ